MALKTSFATDCKLSESEFARRRQPTLRFAGCLQHLVKLLQWSYRTYSIITLST